MSYGASAALQAAVYDCLRGDAGVAAEVGDAVFDAVPVTAPGGVYLALGAEEVRGVADSGGSVSRHDFTVSVLAGGAAPAGFAALKRAGAAVTAALEGADLVTGAGPVAGLWFLRARAARVEKGAKRRVDLTFRALIDLV